MAKSRIPKKYIKSILLALFLFVCGVTLLVLGSLLLTGYLQTNYWDRGYSLLILGSLLFIPGLYYVRVAFYAYKGYRGFSFHQIPEWD